MRPNQTSITLRQSNNLSEIDKSIDENEGNCLINLFYEINYVVIEID